MPTPAIASNPQDSPKRTAILEAALELFVERGFHGTAVPLIAARAGVGAGTIYRYFENKEAIVNTLYQEWKTRISEFVLGDLPMSSKPREQFHAIWERMTTFVGRHPRVYTFLELHHHAAYLDTESRAIEERIFQFASAFVMQAQAQGVLRSGTPAVLLALLHGAFVGLARFASEGRIEWDPAALATAEQACWDLVSADAQS